MATTYTYGGSARLVVDLRTTFSGDWAGSSAASFDQTRTYTNAGGTEPDIAGYIRGSVTCAAGDWVLAHATDPFGTMGDAVYSPGLTVASNKIKLLIIHNTDGTNSLTVTRKAAVSGGLANILAADADAFTVGPGAIYMWQGATAALTASTNDTVTISVSAGAPVATVLIAYGT